MIKNSSILKKDEAGKVLEVLEANETEMPNNWNKRYKENMDKISVWESLDAYNIISDNKVLC